MKRAKTDHECRNVKKRELLVGGVLVYPVSLLLANMAIVAATHASIGNTKRFANEDGLSRKTSSIASVMAGYDVAVACYDQELDVDLQGNETRLGQVTRYGYLDLTLKNRVASFNPASLQLRRSLCRSIVKVMDSPDSMTERQDSFVAYSTLLHEIVHLEETTYDETRTQCEAIQRMPAVMIKLGFNAANAAYATSVADEQSRLLLAPGYHEYAC